MEPNELLQGQVAEAAAALAAVDATDPVRALPHLREAADAVTRAIDEAMAAVVLLDGLTLRAAGDLVGLSENAVGPRLARTTLLGAYGQSARPGPAPDDEEAPASGRRALSTTPAAKARITARGIERARYDLELGRHVTADADEVQPLRFKPRRP